MFSQFSFYDKFYFSFATVMWRKDIGAKTARKYVVKIDSKKVIFRTLDVQPDKPIVKELNK